MRTIDVHVVSKVAHSVRFRFEARSQGGLQSGQEVPTQFIHPSLKIAALQPQGPFKVGDEVSFKFEVHNTGTVPLTNVRIVDTYESGLQHTGNQPSPLLLQIGTLKPDEPVRKAVAFRALRAGRHCHTIRVTADGGQSDSVRSCIEVAPADPPEKPKLTLKIEGSASHRLGEPDIYDFIVRN